MSKPEEEPKLIIDEDWKTQVQREREELKQRLDAEAAQASSQEFSNSTTHSPVARDTVGGNAGGGNAGGGNAGGGDTGGGDTGGGNAGGGDTGGGDTGGGNAGGGNTVKERKSTGQAKSPSLPPASFTLLVTTLATQAMAAMGLMLAPEDEATPPVNLDFAKHFIDMLSVLEDKTKGNLVDAERTFLQDTLHQLRMAFVAVSDQSPAT